MSQAAAIAPARRRSVLRLALWIAALLSVASPGVLDLGWHLIGEESALGRRLFRPPLDVDLRLWAESVQWIGGLAIVLLLYTRGVRRASRRPTRAKALFVNLGLSVVVLLAGWTAIECGLRLKPIATDRFGLYQGSRHWFRKYVEYNSWCFRGREFDRHKPPDTLRVIVIGDSVAFGHGINDPGEVLAAVLERRLTEAAGRPIQVINMAECGAATINEAGWLEFLAMPLEPDAVVLVHVFNDIQDSAEEPVRVEAAGPVVSWLVRHSYLADSLLTGLRVRYTGKRPYEEELADLYATPAVWDRHASILRWCGRFCRTRDVPLVVAIDPLLACLDNYPAGLAAVHARLQALCREEATACVDLREALRGYPADRLMVNSRDLHPNALAHRLMAEALVQPLLTALRAPDAPRQPAASHPAVPDKPWAREPARIAVEGHLALQPESVAGLVALAQHSNWIEGSKYLAAALKRDPGHALARYLYGRWWIYQGRYDLARDQYRLLASQHSPLADRLWQEIP